MCAAGSSLRWARRLTPELSRAKVISRTRSSDMGRRGSGKEPGAGQGHPMVWRRRRRRRPVLLPPSSFSPSLSPSPCQGHFRPEALRSTLQSTRTGRPVGRVPVRAAVEGGTGSPSASVGLGRNRRPPRRPDRGRGDGRAGSPQDRVAPGPVLARRWNPQRASFLVRHLGWTSCSSLSWPLLRGATRVPLLMSGFKGRLRRLR